MKLKIDDSTLTLLRNEKLSTQGKAMPELGEAIAISQIDTSKHNKSTCPFCMDEEPKTGIKNKLDNSPEKLRIACNKEDVRGLPEPCTGTENSRQWYVVYTHPESLKDEICEVRSNPHHCIPGNASLKGKAFEHNILEAIEESKGTITDDIGYDVNGKPNGIWLPSIIEDFYAGYKNIDPIAGISWGTLTKKFKNEQFSMAEAAMFETSRQFHDSHEDYSEHVKTRLDKLFNKVKLRKTQCPEAGPKAKPNVPPPYGLVNWLNSLSFGLSGHLQGDPLRWRIPLFTSRHAEEFHDKIKAKNTKGNEQ